MKSGITIFETEIAVEEVEYHPYEKETGYGGGLTFNCFAKRVYLDGTEKWVELNYDKLKPEHQKEFDYLAELDED